MNNSCDKFKLKIQAIADGEVDKDDKDLSDTFLHLSTCASCRDDYHQLVTLNKKLSVNNVEQPTEEWFTKIEKERKFKFFRNLGLFLLLIPFLILMGGSLWEMVNSSNEILIVKVSVITMIIGVLVLLGYTFVGKIKEDKNDKYKGIVR